MYVDVWTKAHETLAAYLYTDSQMLNYVQGHYKEESPQSWSSYVSKGSDSPVSE